MRLKTLIGKETALKFKARCKLCNLIRGVEHQPLNITVVGQPDRATAELFHAELKHLKAHHSEALMQGIAMNAEFEAWRVLSQFEYEDPTVAPRLEMIRGAVFQTVRKNGFPDSTLLDLTARLGLNSADASKVYEVLKTVRDACCETGQFAATLPEESKLVKV